MKDTPSDFPQSKNESLGADRLDTFFRQDEAAKAAKSTKQIQDNAYDSTSIADFATKVMPQAERVASRLGVSVDSIIGQWGLETGWGKHVIPGTNNLGNIKDFSGNGVAATDNATGTRDKYKVYDSLDSFADGHADLLSRRYQGALNAGSDANKFFTGLRAGGYAEDPTYVEKGTAAAAMVAKARQGMQPAQQEQPKPLAIDSAPKWSKIVAKDGYKSLSVEDRAGVREAYFNRYIAPDLQADQIETYRSRFYHNADQIEPQELTLLDRAKATVKKLYVGSTKAEPDNPDAVYDPVTGVELTGHSNEADIPRSQRSVMDNFSQKDATPNKIQPQFDPSVVGFANASRNLRAYQDARAQDIEKARMTEGHQLINGEGRKATPIVNERTWGQAAGDTFDAAAKIVPTALKGAADITAMLTNDAVGRDFSDYMQSEIDNIDAGSSPMMKSKRAELNFQMSNDNYSAGDILNHLVTNPSILIDQAAPSVGSMFLPAGAARGAIGLAARLGGNASKFATVATLGTVAAQNAADTFAELRGLPTEDRYAGATVAATISVLAGIATKGGAEGQIARKMIGEIEHGKTTIAAARELIKGMTNEAFQEGGEEFGNALGEAIGKDEDIDPRAVVKRMTLAGTLGAAIGGGTDIAVHASGENSDAKAPLQPIVPKPAYTAKADPVEPTATPVAEFAPTAKPVDTTANKDLVDYAEYRKEILTAKRDGEAVDVPSEDGSKMVTVDKAGKGLSKSEQAELTAIEQAGTDAEKLAAIYPDMKEAPANVPEPAKVEQKATTAQATEVATPEPVAEPATAPAAESITSNATESKQDTISRLMEQAKVEKGIDKPTERNKAFQRGMIDAVEGKEPQRASSAYIAGHTFAQDKLNNKETVKNEPQATETALPAVQEEARQGSSLPEQSTKSEQVKAEQAATGVPEATAGSAQPVSAKPKTEKQAAQQADYSDKWFGSQDKAQAFIDKKRIGDTHQVVPNGKKFEIKAKSVEALPVEAPKPAPTQKITTPDTAPVTHNFGTGDIEVKHTMSFSPEDYKRIYGKEGGILSFELRGKGLNSETGYKSVAGITYSGKMTADRLQELMQRIAQENAKPVAPEPKAKPKTEKVAMEAKQKTVDAKESNVELVSVKDSYGQTHYVKARELNNNEVKLLKRFKKDGTPITGEGKSRLHRGNIDANGSKAADNWKSLPYITAKGDRPFANVNAANTAIKKLGQSPSDFDIQEMSGGYVAVRKSIQTQARADAKPATDLNSMFDDLLAEEVAKTKTAATDKAEVYPMPTKRPRTEKAAKERKSAKRKAEENAKFLEDYFTPGNIVHGYGGFDRVISYKPATNTEYFEVKVQAVEKKGDNWVEVGNPRIHSTAPSAEYLPVVRAGKTEAVKQPTSIVDFGEKIGGAKKDVWTGFRDKMATAKKLDVAAEPLSKSWPEPDYQALLDNGADAWAVGFMHAARDAVPRKPARSYKLKAWATGVETLRNFAADIADGMISAENVKAEMKKLAGTHSPFHFDDLLNRIDLYQAVGHSKSLADVRIVSGEYALLNGVEYKPSKIIWTVEKKSAATAFSNFPQQIAEGDTKQAAIDDFKAKFAALDISKPANKEITFDVFSERGEDGFFVGKKIGRNFIKLAGAFPSVKEARSYKSENRDELVAKLEKAKEIPRERRDTNNPRIGEDMRDGQDVTPEMFADAFGFRGVEFGNYVEQAKRQLELNQAYDALMDMAALLDIPPKSISLNGSLGLAFGARGNGGKQAHAAHYEKDKIVINLTKKSGAGSLGHEWWHALDNYFSRSANRPSDYMTERLDVSLSAKGSNFIYRDEGVRKEMIDAFGAVMKAIRTTAIKARSSKLDGKRTKEYWTTDVEMSARAFESYLISKLQDNNASNDYLANIVDPETWAAAEKIGFELDDSYPYPTAGEIPAIRAGFDYLFSVIDSKETDQGIALFSRIGGYRSKFGFDVDELQSIVIEITSSWKNAPEINVVQTVDDLHFYAPDNVRGAYYQGQVYLVAANLRNRVEAEAVILHEALGHAGLNGVFGEDLSKELTAIHNNNANVASAAKTWRLNNLDIRRGMSDKRYFLVSIEEALADMAGSGRRITGTQRLLAAIQKGLRAIGLNSLADWMEKATDAEALLALASARKHIENGPDVRIFGQQQAQAFSRYRKNDLSTDAEKSAFLNGSPIANLNSSDAPKGGYKEVQKWAADIFAAQGGIAHRLEVGDVILDERAAKSSMAHGGANKYKKIAFVVVKDVIENGALVHKETQGAEDNFYFSAPVEIDGTVNIETVLVRRDANTKRMYLHSVTTKENLLNQRVSSADFSEKSERSGSTNAGGITTLLQRLINFNTNSVRDASNPSTTDATSVLKSLRQTSKTLTGNDISIVESPEARNINAQDFESSAGSEKEDLLNKRVSSAENKTFSERSGSTNSEGVENVLQKNGKFNTDSAKDGDEGQTFSRMKDNSDGLGFITQRSQQDLIKEFGKPSFSNIDWWDKSVGTQFHKAAKNPHFKKVFDLFVSRENATSLTAIRAAELAPGFLPRIDDFKSAASALFGRKKSSIQNDLAAQAILEGTLGGDSVLDGKLWSDEELKGRGLNETGIALYRQARRAIDASMDEVAAAEAYASVQMFVPRRIRDAVLNDPKNARAILQEAIELRLGMEKKRLERMSRNKEEGAKDLESDVSEIETALSTADKIFEHADLLKQAGYAPLMRFGKYFVAVEEIDPSTGKTVVNEKGEPNTLYFSRYETEGEAQEAYFRQSAAHGKVSNIVVRTGKVNDQKYKMYAGLSPETLALFAEALGAKEVENKFYQEAISERSSLKRRLERKSIKGYSKDMPRVLANFITSNGRHAAGRYYSRDILSAIKYIPREKGDVQEEAQKLKEYLDNPDDPGAIGSSVAFVHFLGGSPASAAVNATQPVLMTFPYLSQWGTGSAAAELTKAAPYAMGKKEIVDSQLRLDLKRASQEGKVDAQEIFHLYTVGIQGVAGALTGKASKLPFVGDKVKGASESARARINAALTLWGMPFAMVEGFNRRLTFIAAWNMAKDQGMPDPYSFAVRAVDETQGIYNKVNRPNRARSSVGRALFTFAQFRIMNVELLRRMIKFGGPEGKKAAALYLAVLILASGTAGFPYADDIDDIIDSVGQFEGYNTNMKRTKREWAHKTLGKFYGDMVLYGVSSSLPLDFGNRLGLGNMIPGTGLFKKSNEGKRVDQILEIAGPLYGGLIGKQAIEAYDQASMGNYGKAATAFAPKAIGDVVAGLDMINTGKAKDLKGREKVDVSPLEGAIKVVGFTPTKVAEVSRKNMPIQQDLTLQKIVENDIVDTWAQGIAQNDKKMQSDAMEKMKEWNTKNPETPVAISAAQLRSRVRDIHTPPERRLMKTAPKEMKGRVAAGLDMDH